MPTESLVSVPSTSTPPASAAVPMSPMHPGAVATTQPGVIQMMPPPKLEIWEGPGFFPSIAAIIAVVISYRGLQSSTQKQINAAALRSKEQFDHAIAQARLEREHSAEQARLEREHSERQARLDRLQDARQELYAELIDDYMDVLGMFATMPHLDPAKQSTFSAPLQKLGASVNKTWLLSEVATARVVRDFYSNLNEMYFRLLEACKPIFAVRERIANLRKRLEEAAENEAAAARESDRNQNASSSFIDMGTVRQHQVARRRQPLANELESAQHELAQKVNAYVHTIAKEQAAMMVELNGLMAAARSETGHTEDMSVLVEQSDEMTKRAAAALARVLGDTQGGEGAAHPRGR